MDLAGLPWGTITPSGVLLLVVVLILRGDLVPRKIHEEVKTERDFYRNVATERSRQVAALLPSVDTANKMMEAVVRAAREPGGET